MNSVENSYSEGLIVDSLNRLQTVKGKLTRMPNAESEIFQVIRHLKEYLMTVKINRDVFDDMQKEIFNLRKEKEAVITHHKETLQNLEMLLYQNDVQELKTRFSQFKSWEPTPSNPPQLKKHESSLGSQLDCAFVLDEQENQFLDCVQISSKENSPIKESLKLMNSPPMQKKAGVCLEIMFSKNSEEDAPRGEVKRRAKELSDFSQITPTQDLQHVNRQTDRIFTGKKVKSMILLKDKVKKGNSKAKTSAKKPTQNIKEHQNVESNSKIKKKMLFPSSKLVDHGERQSAKKKIVRQSQICGVRSFRKTIINHL